MVGMVGMVGIAGNGPDGGGPVGTSALILALFLRGKLFLCSIEMLDFRGSGLYSLRRNLRSRLRSARLGTGGGGIGEDGGLSSRTPKPNIIISSVTAGDRCGKS